MKGPNKYVLLLMVTLFGVTLASAHAQSRVSVNIPFDFTVGDTTLKAGSYHIEKQDAPGIVSFRGDEGRAVYALLTPRGTNDQRADEPYLLFTRYQGEAFLDTVVFSKFDDYDLPRGNREKELISKLKSGEQVAVLIPPSR